MNATETMLKWRLIITLLTRRCATKPIIISKDRDQLCKEMYISRWGEEREDVC